MTGDANRRRRAEWIALIAALAFVALAVLVPTGATSGFDAAVLRGLRRADDPSVPLGGKLVADGARDVTALGSVVVLTIVVALVLGWLVADGRRRAAAAVAAAALGGVALDVAMKLLFGRDRPDAVPHLADVHSASFPSGHLMLSAVIYPTLGALLARFSPRPRLDRFALAASAGLAALVGVSRLVLGVHHPTDVLAGWAAGAAWASVSWLAVDRLARRGSLGADAAE